MNDTLASDMDG